MYVVFQTFLKQSCFAIGEGDVGVVDNSGVECVWGPCGVIVCVSFFSCCFFVQILVFGLSFSTEFFFDLMLHVRPLFILATVCLIHKHASLLNQHNGDEAPQSNNTNSVPSRIYHKL